MPGLVGEVEECPGESDRRSRASGDHGGNAAIPSWIVGDVYQIRAKIHFLTGTICGRDAKARN